MFDDRQDAGERLALVLAEKIDKDEKGLVLAIPRGGVVLGKIIADKFNWPLSVLVTKKIGYPHQPELAMGAIAEDGEPVWDERLRRQAGLTEEEERQLVEKIRKEKVEKYIEKFRGGTPLDVKLDKTETVVIVDDGIATGKTVEAGIKYLQGSTLKIDKVVMAVPVCAKSTAVFLKRMAPRARGKFNWVCLMEPINLMAIGQFYKDFSEVTDDEVKMMLK